MQICGEHGRDDIVHNERTCPVCDQLAQLQIKIDELEETVAQYRAELDAIFHSDEPGGEG